MKETPKCAGCPYMGWPVPRRITGNNRHLGGPRSSCMCRHPEAVASFRRVCPKSPRLEAFIGFHKAGRQNACHQNLTALVPSARGKRRPRPGELQGGERLMTEPKDLCGRCAAMLQEGYDLKRVGGGVDHKVTCSHCGRRRYGATYTIEKHSKSKA